MHFKYIKKLLYISVVIILSGCGSSTNKESSNNNLLDENAKPVAKNKIVQIYKNQKTSIILEGSDEDNDTLVYVLNSYPSHGMLKGKAPNLIYIPIKDYVGKDSFSYVVNDGIVNSKKAIIDINILPTNDKPIAYNDVCKLQEDTNVTIDVLANDIDKDDGLDINTLTITKQPIHGIVKLINGKILYQPDTNYVGKDSFSYTIKDKSKAVSNEARVDITILPVNDAPVAVDDVAKTDENRSIVISPLLNDIDPDGNNSKLHIVSITKPKYGLAKLEDKLVMYAPKSDWASKDVLSYTIEDEEGAKSTAKITINIGPLNDAPKAYNDTIYIKEDESVTFKLKGNDPDKDSISYKLVYNNLVPQNGIANGNLPSLKYTPKRNFTGDDYIAFVVSDGSLESAIAIIKIVVIPRNDPPIANAGKDIEIIRGDSVMFDGSKSYDIDGNITSYEWKEADTILSTQMIFEKPMLIEGKHIVTLSVTDNGGLKDIDKKVIIVKPCCKGCNYPDPTSTNPFK